MSSMRPYQQKAIELIRKEYQSGHKKTLLHLATGGGKTHIFSDILKTTASKKNPCIMVVRGRHLVEQASQRLFREGVEHGVQMASHWNKNHGALVQICSIDTLISRRSFPRAKLVVIDEAHLFTSHGCKEFLSHYEDSFVLAVTATPFTKESLAHLADTVIHPIGMQELIDQGYLVPPRYFAPSSPNLRGVRTRSGDYVNDELEERMNVLTGDIVSHWKKLGENRPTIAFAVNLRHSKHIVDQFKMAGIPAEHIEGENTHEERELAISKLKSGEIKILSNVGVLCTGVDIPFVSAILMARPTKSYNLYIQQAGRGTRASERKNDFIVLDHAGNVLRHGFITDEREVDLNGVESKPKELTPRVCEECFAIYTGSICHACGKAAPINEKRIQIENKEGELKELTKQDQVKIFVKTMKELAKKRGYKRGWAYYKTIEKYGQEIADVQFPKKYIPPWIKTRT